LYFTKHNEIIKLVKDLHFEIYDEISKRMKKYDHSIHSKVEKEGNGDYSYNIDIFSEQIIEEYFQKKDFPGGIVIVSEGIGEKVYPESMSNRDAKYKLIIDPVDGTRELMYDKRSAWIITGIAKNIGDDTTLNHIEVSIQTELPTTKQNLSSVIVAVLDEGSWETIWDIKKRKIVSESKRLKASTSKDLLHGYAVFTNYFPGARKIISGFADSIVSEFILTDSEDKSLIFDDQYISTGGQMYLLAKGVYRFAIDFRPLLTNYTKKKGYGKMLSCHPYDLGGYLIVKEAGGIITSLDGGVLDYPLDVKTDCAWVAYANENIKLLLENKIQNEINPLKENINGYDQGI